MRSQENNESPDSFDPRDKPSHLGNDNRTPYGDYDENPSDNSYSPYEAKENDPL